MKAFKSEDQYDVLLRNRVQAQRTRHSALPCMCGVSGCADE